MGPTTTAGLAAPAAPPLRFGISPNVVAGQVGPPAAAAPDDPSADLAALTQLRGDRAFVLRLTRLFWSGGAPAIAQYAALARHYVQAGLGVEVQLRYQPPAGHDGDIAGWVTFVRAAVDALGPIPGVVGLQVTNEVNFTESADSSDGANAGARDALIQGVIAAKAEARRLGLGGLRIGFNWFYRNDPPDDQAFWTYLGQHGGPAFVAAVDWVGLDAYPGTFFPPSEPAGGYADGVVNALSVLRDCYMPMAALGASIPIQVEENGYPTGPGRSPDTQVQALREMVGAVSRYRGTFGVSDYRWFNLRDADSSSPNFQQQFGLLTSAYVPKPAFGAYRSLVAELGAAPAPSQLGATPTSSGSPSAPEPSTPTGLAPRPAVGRRALRVHLRVSDRRGRVSEGRCVANPVRVSVFGVDAHHVRRVTVWHDRLALAQSGRGRPPAVGLPATALTRGRVTRLLVRVSGTAAPRALILRLRPCAPYRRR